MEKTKYKKKYYGRILHSISHLMNKIRTYTRMIVSGWGKSGFTFEVLPSLKQINISEKIEVKDHCVLPVSYVHPVSFINLI